MDAVQDVVEERDCPVDLLPVSGQCVAVNGDELPASVTLAVEQLRDRREGHSCLLAPDRDREGVDVLRVVPSGAGGSSSRDDDSLGFPMPQEVSGDPQACGGLTDAHAGHRDASPSG